MGYVWRGGYRYQYTATGLLDLKEQSLSGLSAVAVLSFSPSPRTTHTPQTLHRIGPACGESRPLFSGEGSAPTRF